MFFVGATGQILTLILTVCLPFVLIFSGNQKIEVQSQANLVLVNQSVQEILITSYGTNDHLVDFAADATLNLSFRFEDIPDIHIFPPDFAHTKWKSVYSSSSGNKAPPVILAVFC